MDFSSLPSEIIRNVAIFLKTPYKLLLLSKRFRYLQDDKLFWKEKLQIDFPNVVPKGNDYKATWREEYKKYRKREQMRRTVKKRLEREIKDIEQNKDENIDIGPISSDLFYWAACICGPKGTPYEGGLFRLEMRIPDEYPFRPPRIGLTTKIYHPNVSERGGISLAILHDQWSPALKLVNVAKEVFCLIEEPNPDDPLRPEIGHIYKTNRAQFNATAKEWTKKYAT